MSSSHEAKLPNIVANHTLLSIQFGFSPFKKKKNQLLFKTKDKNGLFRIHYIPTAQFEHFFVMRKVIYKSLVSKRGLKCASHSYEVIHSE